MNWYIDVIKQYAVFTGRARRKEYWMFFLFNILIAISLAFVEGILGTGGVIGVLFMLAFLLPGIGVAIRRLHDTDKSGWWLLILLVPIVGFIVFTVFLCQDGTKCSNRFGSNPKFGEHAID